MNKWQARIIENIQPTQDYDREAVKNLSKAPPTFLDRASWPTKGSTLLKMAIEYRGPKGRALLGENRKRTRPRVFRVSESEHSFLKSFCEENGLTLSALIRKALLGHTFPDPYERLKAILLTPLMELQGFLKNESNIDLLNYVDRAIFNLDDLEPISSFSSLPRECRNKVISVFFSSDEFDKTKSLAEGESLPLSEYLRVKLSKLHRFNLKYLNNTTITCIINAANVAVCEIGSIPTIELKAALMEIGGGCNELDL